MCGGIGGRHMLTRKGPIRSYIEVHCHPDLNFLRLCGTCQPWLPSSAVWLQLGGEQIPSKFASGTSDSREAKMLSGRAFVVSHQPDVIAPAAAVPDGGVCGVQPPHHLQEHVGGVHRALPCTGGTAPSVHRRVQLMSDRVNVHRGCWAPCHHAPMRRLNRCSLALLPPGTVAAASLFEAGDSADVVGFSHPGPWYLRHSIGRDLSSRN